MIKVDKAFGKKAVLLIITVALLSASNVYSSPVRKDCLRPLSSFQGKERKNSPIKALAEKPELRYFIEEYLSKRYKYWGLPEDLASRIMRTLAGNAGDVEESRREVYTKVIDFDKDEQWNAVYKRYKDATKYVSAYSQVEKFIKDLPARSMILDIGAGNNAFGATMAENLPYADIVGVDVMDYHEERNMPNLTYLKQSSPTKLPEEIVNQSVDVITINAVFHHVSGEFVDDLINEITRVLKPGGKVILIEDTYSLELPIDGTSDRELTERFLALVRKHGAQFARDFFTFNDWYANVLVHKWDEMAFPYEFKSIEEWQEIFRQKGLELLYAHHIGFPDNGFHKPGLGIMVFTRGKIAEQTRDRHIHLEGAISTKGLREICRELDRQTKEIFSDERREEFWEWMAYHYSKGRRIQRFTNVGPEDIKRIILDPDNQDPDCKNLRRYAEYNPDVLVSGGFENGLKRFLHTSYGIRAVLFDFTEELSLMQIVADNAIKDVAQSLYSKDIGTADLRCTPLRRGEPVSHQLLQALIKSIICEEEKGFQINLVISFSRNVTKNAAEKGFNNSDNGYREYIDKYYIEPLRLLSGKELSYLKGVDITGNELNSIESTLKNIPYINYFIEKISELREKEGIASEFTVYAHVGEVFRTPEEGLEAIKIYAEQLKGIKYIVHAAALRYADMNRFKEICDILKARKIGILISLTSNLSTGAIEEISQYPAVLLIEAGVDVYPTTDDPGALGIDLNDETMLLKRLIAASL